MRLEWKLPPLTSDRERRPLQWPAWLRYPEAAVIGAAVVTALVLSARPVKETPQEPPAASVAEPAPVEIQPSALPGTAPTETADAATGTEEADVTATAREDEPPRPASKPAATRRPSPARVAAPAARAGQQTAARGRPDRGPVPPAPVVAPPPVTALPALSPSVRPSRSVFVVATTDRGVDVLAP